MTTNAGEIVYTVDIDTSKTVSGTKEVNKQLDSLESGLSEAAKAAGVYTDAAGRMREANGRFVTSARKAELGIKDVGASAGAVVSRLHPLTAAISAVVSFETLRQLQQLSEQFTLLESRVKRLSGSAEDAAATYRNLLAISSETGVAMSDTVKLWESLTGSLRELGKTDTQILALTSTLQKIGTIGGSSAQELSDSLRQLGQGLAGGVLRAEEFNSVLENTPEIARQIAQGLGVTLGELRQQMLDGQLTAERVLGAIEKRSADVDKEFAKLPRTVAQAGNAITTAMGAAISKIDQATGASQALARALDAVAQGIRRASGEQTLADIAEEIGDIEKALANTRTRMLMGPQLEANLKSLKERQAEILKQQKEMNQGPARTPGRSPGAASPAAAEDSKELIALQQQAELARLTGVERAKLAAIQKLGADASEDERAEAAALAEEIYQLNDANKAAVTSGKQQEKATKDATKSIEENASVIAALREQIYQAGLSAQQLALRQAELRLNEYATPEQIAQAKQLADELFRAEEAQRRRAAFGENVIGTIKGEVTPLAGGMFDEQTARYDAEATAENERYAAQLERLKQAKELELQVTGGYQQLEEQLAQQHADRIAQIEQAKNSVLLQTAASTFDSLAGLAQQFAGEQSGIYKVMFAASKAFALADAAIKIQQGIASAAAIPFPANLAAIGTVVAATSSILSTIGSTNMGRQYGGPVTPGGMYRINESGAPEVFNAANGRQYMLPNQRGDVVSNKDAQQNGGSANVQINIVNNTGAQVSQSERTVDDKRVIDIVVGDMMSDGKIARATNQITGTRRPGQ